MSKVSKKNPDSLKISYAGPGSYEWIKSHDTKGIFWTSIKEGYSLMDKRGTTIKESSFCSYEEFEKYCKQTYSEGIITT